MDYYEKIIKLLGGNKVPVHIRKDVLNRCFDWFQSRGSEGDNYIKNQYDYLLRVISR